MSSFLAPLPRTLATHLHLVMDTPCLSQKGIQAGEQGDGTTSIIFLMPDVLHILTPQRWSLDQQQWHHLSPLRNADSGIHPDTESRVCILTRPPHRSYVHSA